MRDSVQHCGELCACCSTAQHHEHGREWLHVGEAAVTALVGPRMNPSRMDLSEDNKPFA